jgi:U32 family peptidase
MFKPELLSPAGYLNSMRYAFAYGADAVYAGQPRYSLRVRNNEFNRLETLQEGIDEAHALGKNFYVVSNIAPHNSKIKTFLDDIRPVIAMRPDALIMSDPGLIMLVREHFPAMAIHLSVQANAVNYATVKFWQQFGLQRVILSRELSVNEIAEIRAQVPDMELEVFVHGALCIAYSGRCLLSGYINHRDANQGTCTNACRWKYQAHDAKQTEAGDIIFKQRPIQQELVEQWQPQPVAGPGTDEVFLLQDASRPGEFMPAFEDEHGTYIMNSKDLRAVQLVKQFCEMGVHSLKIEGRTKSHYYVARTAQVYRRAIDDAVAGREFDPSLLHELDNLASRGFTEGFYRRHNHDADMQNYTQGTSLPSQQQFVGDVVDYNPQTQLATIDVKNRFAIGDQLELMTPAGNRRFVLQHIENTRGEKRDVAPGSGHVVRIPVASAADLRYGLLMRDFA